MSNVLCAECVRECLRESEGYWPYTRDREPRQVIVVNGESVCEKHYKPEEG